MGVRVGVGVGEGVGVGVGMGMGMGWGERVGVRVRGWVIGAKEMESTNRADKVQAMSNKK